VGELPPLACPACRGPLEDRTSTLGCAACAASYPVVAGIPDLRLRPDRYLDLEGDRAKARELAGLGDRGFADLVAEYWRRTPEVPADLAATYGARATDGERRGAGVLDEAGLVVGGATVLDVGCGTGGLVAAAARRGARAVGVDVALRWLVVARRQLEELGLDARLVAADGAALPFRSGTFDVVTAIETVEHAADQRGLVQGCLRAARPGGRALLVVANRYSLATEPTIGLWGVGYLPRAWAPAYVRRRRQTRYGYFRALSAGELRALTAHGPPARLGPGPLPAAPAGEPRHRRQARRLYDRLRTGPAGALLTPVAPYLAVDARPR